MYLLKRDGQLQAALRPRFCSGSPMMSLTITYRRKRKLLIWKSARYLKLLLKFEERLKHVYIVILDTLDNRIEGFWCIHYKKKELLFLQRSSTGKWASVFASQFDANLIISVSISYLNRAVDSLLFTVVHSVIGLEDRTGRQAHRAAVRAVIQPNRAENKIASV